MRGFAAVFGCLGLTWAATAAAEQSGVTTASPPVQECDRLAGDPRDPNRVALGVRVPSMDGKRALAACRRAAQAHPGAARFAYHMGRAYHALNDYAQAVQWFRKAAHADYAPAMSILGVFYAAGGGVEQSYEEAVRWYRKGAERGYSVAMYNLAVRYADGQGVTRDHALAARWFEKAAARGHIGSMEGLAFIYLRGEGVARDFAKAVHWFERAAAHGRIDAMYHLGWAYDAGRGIEADGHKSAGWFMRALKEGHGRTLWEMTGNRSAPWSSETRRAIQRLLAREGVYSGPIDGAFGSSTIEAITEIARRP